MENAKLKHHLANALIVKLSREKQISLFSLFTSLEPLLMIY